MLVRVMLYLTDNAFMDWLYMRKPYFLMLKASSESAKYSTLRSAVLV